MSVIENFAALSAQEQREFANSLVKTINSEKTFADIMFKIDAVEADDLTGGLLIELSHEDAFELNRKATWTCGDADDAHQKPEDADFDDSIWDDAKKAFKTLTTEIEGYTLSLEIADIDNEEITEVEVEHISKEDAGIGHYEFWGETGYDSQPYFEIEGTLVQECSLSLGLFVEAADNIAEDTEEATEEN